MISFHLSLAAVSMFLGVVLKFIPTSVLFGVFLYMGVASLSSIQLFSRIILLLTPTKHHPVDVGYVRHVRIFINTMCFICLATVFHCINYYFDLIIALRLYIICCVVCYGLPERAELYLFENICNRKLFIKQCNYKKYRM